MPELTKRKSALKKSIAKHWQRKLKVTLATFFLSIAITNCAGIPQGLSLALIPRVMEPNLGFTNEGEHCLTTHEVNALSDYFLGVRAYQELSEAAISAVNND